MRKNYLIKIGLSLLAFIGASAMELKAQNDSIDLYSFSLEELMDLEVYSVSKKGEKLSEVPMSVYQISKEEINRWGTRYLYETMGRVPGFSFYNTDNYGQFGVMARGWQSVWRYGYSIELMPVVDFGHTTFPTEFFKNIEASRGPAGLAWGSSANAGVINANLRDDLDGGEFVGQYGNYNQYSVSGLYGAKLNDKGDKIFFGINQEAQDYEVQKDAFGQPGNDWKINGVRPSQSVVGHATYNGFKGTIYAEHNDHDSPQLWFENAYKKDSLGDWQKTEYAQFWQDIEDSTGQNPHDQLDIICYRLEYKIPLNAENFDLSVYHNFYKRIWYFEPVASLGDHKRDVGFSANIRLLDDDLTINLGSDVYGQNRNGIYTNNHRFAVDRGITWYNSAYQPTDIRYHNAFTQITYNIIPRLKLIAGTRVDYQNDGTFEDYVTFYRGGGVFSLNENTSLKYFYNKAPRRAQTNERSSTSPSAEDLSAHEVAVIGSLNKKFDYNVTLFYQQLKNQITRDPTTFNDFSNTGGLEAYGLEWGLNFLPTSKLLVYWNGSAQNTEVISGTVTDMDGVTKEVSERANADGQPLFVATANSFIGTEIRYLQFVKVNFAWRMVYDIPYKTTEDTDAKATAHFCDVSLISKKFWNKVEFSFVALNVLDNRAELPAYGEHAKNQNGTVEPEGMRFYFKTRITIPNKKS